MQRVEPREQGRNLGQERVRQDCGDLFLASAAGVAHQLTNIDFESMSQAFKRAEGRNRLAVLNLGNVGTRHLHPTGELALAQVSGTADVAHLRRDLQTGFRGGGLEIRYSYRSQHGYVLDVEGFVAAAAH